MVDASWNDDSVTTDYHVRRRANTSMVERSRLRSIRDKEDGDVARCPCSCGYVTGSGHV